MLDRTSTISLVYRPHLHWSLKRQATGVDFQTFFRTSIKRLLQIQRVLVASRLSLPCVQGFRFHTVGLGEPWCGFATKRLAVLFLWISLQCWSRARPVNMMYIWKAVIISNINIIQFKDNFLPSCADWEVTALLLVPLPLSNLLSREGSWSPTKSWQRFQSVWGFWLMSEDYRSCGSCLDLSEVGSWTKPD